jgi:hypothetical protein
MMVAMLKLVVPLLLIALASASVDEYPEINLNGSWAEVAKEVYRKDSEHVRTP